MNAEKKKTEFQVIGNVDMPKTTHSENKTTHDNIFDRGEGN